MNELFDKNWVSAILLETKWDGGRQMAEKAKIICPPPSGVDIITSI